MLGQLNIAEKFILLIHKPIKPGYLISEAQRDSGLAGGFLMDLLLESCLEIKEDKVILTGKESEMSEAHIEILDMISQSGKERKVKTWLMRIKNRGSRWRHTVLYDLQKREILKVDKKKFLFIPYKRSYMMKVEIRNLLINKIREVIFEGEEYEADIASLMGLIVACKMYRILCPDRKERRELKNRMEKLVKEEVISEGVGKLIQEMQAAVIAAVTASTVAVSVSSR